MQAQALFRPTEIKDGVSRQFDEPTIYELEGLKGRIGNVPPISDIFYGDILRR